MSKDEETKQQALLATAHHDYVKGLNSYAFFKTNNQGVGEDLVQDTFLKTWRFIIKGGQVHIMKAFLYHILNRLIIDQYRKHKNSSLDALLEKGYEPPADTENAYDSVDGKFALGMIEFLPETYRKIMHMRFVQNLSIKEVSILTGETRNSVAVQTHRGLAKLKILYDNRSVIDSSKEA